MANDMVALMGLTVKDLRQSAEAVRNGVRVQLTSYAYDNAANDIERLWAAIQRIDGINDNPAHYNQEINEVCDRILRPDLVG